MIIWHCDICGKRITDDGALSRLGGTVWELSGVAKPIFYIEEKNEGGIYLKTIICKECKAGVAYK